MTPTARVLLRHANQALGRLRRPLWTHGDGLDSTRRFITHRRSDHDDSPRRAICSAFVGRPVRRLAFSLTNRSFNQLEDDEESIEHAVMTCCANHVSTSFLRHSRRRLWGIRQTGGSALGLRVASWRTECGDLCSNSASCSTVKSSSIVSYLITLVFISLPPGLFSVKQVKACRLGPKNLDSHRTIRASWLWYARNGIRTINGRTRRGRAADLLPSQTLPRRGWTVAYRLRHDPSVACRAVGVGI